MLNKKFVVIEEEIDGTVYEVEGCALAVNSDEEFAEASKNPWKFLSGAVRHFLKRIQIWAYRLVEEFILTDGEDEEFYELVCEEYSDKKYKVFSTINGIRVYEGKMIDSIRADLTKSERLKRLAWLIPYVEQFTCFDAMDILMAEDRSMYLKAVEVTV